jgi:enoyl-CoA hydratase/carnithine racemase
MNILYSIHNTIGHIVLSNPPFNYLTNPDFENPDTLKEFLSRPELKGVVVSGEGKHFCAGADMDHLAEMAKDPAVFGARLQKGKELLDILRYTTIPVVAAVRGSCFGGGCEIALACHFCFATKTAMFGFPESQHKLLPGLGGTVVAQDTISRRHVIDLVMSGRMVGAEEALAMGLIDTCCESRDAQGEATAFLERLTAERSVSLIRKIMESIGNARRMPAAEALRRETELFCLAAREINDTQA